MRSIPNTIQTWIEYFEVNQENLLSVPWHFREPDWGPERRAIARSIRVFQLGENSDGKTLIRLTRDFSLACQDPELEQAMSKFIKEEQRHASMLGRFMDQVKIPRATRHWSDFVFRRLRRVWNLETSVGVLLTAELVARVYYHALFRACNSPVLRQICRQLLRDEVFHVYFHTHLLQKLRQERLPVFDTIWNAFYRLFHAGTILIVWSGHSAVLKKGGFSFLRYWRVSRRYCEQAITLLQTERQSSHLPRRNLCGIRPS